MISYPSSTSCGLAWKITSAVGICTATDSLRDTTDKSSLTSSLVIEALKGIGIADNKLLQAHTEADSHNPSSPDTA